MTEAAAPRERPAIPRWLLPALLAASAVAYLALRERPSEGGEVEVARPVSEEAKALLGGLAIGDPIGTFEVEGIAGPGVDGEDPATIVVHLRRAGVRLAIAIAPRGVSPHQAPEQSGAHDLFYGHVQADGAEPEGEEIGAALRALRDRVAAHE
ncbi:MAG: hypothetical protein R3B09_33375 [Nannocystaceae bacterium]